MVFKRLLGSLGVGGPSVDTVVDPVPASPGGSLTGRVHLVGGGADVDVEGITLELLARVEAEHDEGESEGVVVFDRCAVGGGFRLAEGESRDVPFTLVLPWETPITVLHGEPLGVAVGVRTELAVAGARDRGDLDALEVGPLPVQEAVLEAFGQLGFGFRSADLEYGHIGGTGQQLPFYQEIELTPPPQYAHAVNEVEVTFLATPDGVDVVLEADRRGGLRHEGHDALTRFTVPHHDVADRDWNGEVEGWMQHLVAHRAVPQPYPVPEQGQHGPGHDDGHRSGPGVGTMVAAGAIGVAAGVAGGLVAAEVVDEVGDFFEDEEDEE